MEVSHRVGTLALYNIMSGSHVAVVIWLLQRAGYDKMYVVYTWYYGYPQCWNKRCCMGVGIVQGHSRFFLGRTYRQY